MLFHERKRLRLFYFLSYFYLNSGAFALFHVSLLITQNTRNAPLILKIISQCFFILFKHTNFIISLLQIFLITSITNCSCKFLLITSVIRSQKLVCFLNAIIAFATHNALKLTVFLFFSFFFLFFCQPYPGIRNCKLVFLILKILQYGGLRWWVQYFPRYICKNWCKN